MMEDKDIEMKGKDIEMKETDEETPKVEDTSKISDRELALADIRNHISRIETAVPLKNQRGIFRTLRSWPKTRRTLTPSILVELINETVPSESELRTQLMNYVEMLPTSMEEETASGDTIITIPESILPEIEIYLGLLVLVALIDNKLNEEACNWSTSLVSTLQSLNRRTLNPLSAKVFFYYSLAHENEDKLAEIRPTLLAAYRTASLHHDEETHVTILNLLLRNYLHFNLYDQADKLQAKTTIKEDATSSNQIARFRFFQGVINALQLNYSGAYEDLQVALRRAPRHTGRGFRLIVTKFSVLVQLLMGEIPNRSIFRAEGLSTALQPYLHLTQAVRVGTLVAYQAVVSKYEDVFRADKTFTLIHRLHNNVIKIGLRKINVAYSRISLADMAAKLNLRDVEDAEFIVAKAIRDKVIDATIDHEGKFVRSNENLDIYSTQEPQEAYHMRINYCLKLHNEAVKAMRYPEEEKKKEDEENKTEDKEGSSDNKENKDEQKGEEEKKGDK